MSPVSRRRSVNWLTVAVLTLGWTLMWGRPSVVIVVGGVLAAIAILLIFPLPSLGYQGRFRPRGVVVLVVRFLADLIVASFHVAWLALRPQAPPPSAIIAVRLRSESDLVLTFTAEIISLVPGSVVVDASQEEHTLYVHILDTKDENDIARARRGVLAQEERLVRAIGSDTELANFGGVR